MTKALGTALKQGVLKASSLNMLWPSLPSSLRLRFENSWPCYHNISQWATLNSQNKAEFVAPCRKRKHTFSVSWKIRRRITISASPRVERIISYHLYQMLKSHQSHYFSKTSFVIINQTLSGFLKNKPTTRRHVIPTLKFLKLMYWSKNMLNKRPFDNYVVTTNL